MSFFKIIQSNNNVRKGLLSNCLFYFMERNLHFFEDLRNL